MKILRWFVEIRQITAELNEAVKQQIQLEDSVRALRAQLTESRSQVQRLTDELLLAHKANTDWLAINSTGRPVYGVGSKPLDNQNPDPIRQRPTGRDLAYEQTLKFMAEERHRRESVSGNPTS